MKKLLLALSLLGTLAMPTFADDIDDIFNPGEGEFEFDRFSNEGILLKIDQDARVACSSDGQCKLSSVRTDAKGWEVSFNLGQGGAINSGSGTTIITGGYDGKGGSSCNTCDQLNWVLTVAYRSGQCVQTVMVPRSLYYAMNRYMYGLMTETGETKRGFTPADEAMIMFYTTIMKQANGCQPSGK